MRDDEIQVLGSSEAPQRHKYRALLRGIAAILLAAVLCTSGYLLYGKFNRHQSLEKVMSKVGSDPDLLFHRSELSCVDDTVGEDDVPLRIYCFEYMSASLTMDEAVMADSAGIAPMAIIQATDIRKDNGQPVGDIVIDGRRLAGGKSRKGYCAIIGGKVIIGIDDGYEVMNYCIEQGGSFFREYPLIVDGVIYENNARGKKERRALVAQGNSIYVFESIDRESLYDFSTALLNSGVKNAINLPGGINYMMVRGDGTYFENERQNEGGCYIILKPQRPQISVR